LLGRLEGQRVRLPRSLVGLSGEVSVGSCVADLPSFPIDGVVITLATVVGTATMLVPSSAIARIASSVFPVCASALVVVCGPGRLRGPHFSTRWV
jgi:hypothetical protein